MDLKIGDLAKRTGTNAPTIRYYEDIGLIPRARRRDGGQRSYGPADVRLLTFIRQCREFGFSVERVRDLVALMQDRTRDCVAARDIAQTHLDEVRAKLRDLRSLESSLFGFVQSCENRCAGGPGSGCVILQDLATPQAKSARRKRAQ